MGYGDLVFYQKAREVIKGINIASPLFPYPFFEPMESEVSRLRPTSGDAGLLLRGPRSASSLFPLRKDQQDEESL